MTAVAKIVPGEADEAPPAGMFGPLGQAIAVELMKASHLLDELTYDLGSDPDTLRKHMASLQQIDRVTQIQVAAANLLRSTGTIEQGIGEITLEDVQARLRAATTFA